ncbi:MAG: hypothetical protein LBB48_03190 [Treponema sp.]|jgi:hypothetical protein|nr:hypothetical protein [Treponema sp.]
MKKNVYIIVGVIAAALLSCATTGGNGDSLSLEEAIEQSAAELAEKLPAGTRVVIAAFDSEHGNVSAYIMDELAGGLGERRS